MPENNVMFIELHEEHAEGNAKAPAGAQYHWSILNDAIIEIAFQYKGDDCIAEY